MRVALDTNVVIRNAHRADPQNARLAMRLGEAINSGAEFCIPSQAIFESWVVATRPVDVNGLGLSPAEARIMVDVILKAFTVLPDRSDLLTSWLDLCTQYKVSGRQAHDARVVAWMIGHGITRLMTLNQWDFSRYSEIEAVSPLGP